jgi:hypothetical protein
MDNFDPLAESQKKAPDYYNPRSVVTEDSSTHPILAHEPVPEDPQEVLRKKYPIKTIVAGVVIFVVLLAIPVTVYLSQRPTRIFLEAETPTPTPTESPTPTPTSSS